MHRRSISALVSGLLVAGLFFTAPPSPVAAAGFALTVYGNANFSPTSTAHVFGYTSVADLSTVLYGNGNQGDCPSQFWRPNNPNTWYDCISSFTITGATCHQGITFYYGPNYSQPLGTFFGNGSYATIPNGWNDNYYSFSSAYRATCPLSPG